MHLQACCPGSTINKYRIGHDFLDKLTLSEMQAVASARGTYYVMKYVKTRSRYYFKGVERAKQAGADGADVSFIKGGGQDVQVRQES